MVHLYLTQEPFQQPNSHMTGQQTQMPYFQAHTHSQSAPNELMIRKWQQKDHSNLLVKERDRSRNLTLSKQNMQGTRENLAAFR